MAGIGLVNNIYEAAVSIDAGRKGGLDPIEKKLLEQRLANLATAQSGYVEKQKKALVVIFS